MKVLDQEGGDGAGDGEGPALPSSLPHGGHSHEVFGGWEELEPPSLQPQLTSYTRAPRLLGSGLSDPLPLLLAWGSFM